MSSSSGAEFAVDADAREAALPPRREFLLELALAAAHDRREHVDAFVAGKLPRQVEDAIDRLAGDRLAAARAVRLPEVGKQQAQVVVDLGDRADGGARVGRRRLLLDRDRRRQPVDQVDVGLLHLLEELARVRRHRLDVAPLPFRVDRVEGERRLARPREAGDHDESIAWEIDVDVLQVVDARAAHRNALVGGHGADGRGPQPGDPNPHGITAGTGSCRRRRALR